MNEWCFRPQNEMISVLGHEIIGVLGHNSALEGYTGPGTTWLLGHDSAL